MPAQIPAQTPDADMARRMLACTPCHGKEGRATSAGYFPRIAGKPAGYLFNQLVNFRAGRRHGTAMADLVEHMNDAYLRDIAAYFAALDLPYAPPPQTPAQTPPGAAAAAAVLARGEALARRGDPQRGVPACTACHGARLTGVLPALPGLVGLPRDYLLGQLGAWRQGDRHAASPDCMETIARHLDDADIVAVTLWISSQPPAADMKPAAAGTLAQPLPLACGSGLQ
ncbi:MAG: cytochrome c4 [Burkholderiales bacterium]|nr:cytochrome c4 [Burkholderiales bacterium]